MPILDIIVGAKDLSFSKSLQIVRLQYANAISNRGIICCILGTGLNLPRIYLSTNNWPWIRIGRSWRAKLSWQIHAQFSTQQLSNSTTIYWHLIHGSIFERLAMFGSWHVSFTSTSSSRFPATRRGQVAFILDPDSVADSCVTTTTTNDLMSLLLTLYATYSYYSNHGLAVFIICTDYLRLWHPALACVPATLIYIRGADSRTKNV